MMPLKNLFLINNNNRSTSLFMMRNVLKLFYYNLNKPDKKHLNANLIIQSKRNIFSSSIFSSSSEPNDKSNCDNSKKIRVHYITKKGEKITVEGNEGDNIMHLAQRYSIDIEGACEASLACCTCHVYVNDNFYKKLPEPTEEEEDLLDMAPFLKSNSRLGCQIILNEDLQDIEITLPQATRNFYVDDHKPTHH